MTSASDPIVLYDLPSKGRRSCWSLNPWKTRMLLNYKGLHYKTEWVEYPDLKPTLEKHLPPNETGFSYSSPAVRLPDGTYIMDSRKIANRIEELYPSPSVHLDSPVLASVEAGVPKIADALRPVFQPLVPEVLLNPRSKEYYERTRQQTLGKPLSEYAKGADLAYENAVAPLKEITALLKGKGGPFFLGKEFSYSDIVLAGLLTMLDRLGVLENVLEELDEYNRDIIIKFYKECGPYLGRDDH